MTATLAESTAGRILLPPRPTAAEMRAAPSLKAAMHDLDRRRARSRQRKIGASEVGECRRRAAYRIAGRRQTNPPRGLQAALGTAIHKDVLRALRLTYGGITEVKVASEQLKGSADWLDTDTFPDAPIVEDLKTTSERGYEKVLASGPYTKHWFQVMLYAYLMRLGVIVDRRLVRVGTTQIDVAGVRLRYLSRSSGEDEVFPAEYDPFLAAEAIAWLAGVYLSLEEAHGDPEEIERDGFGPGIDSMCDYCPFLDACWGPPLTADETEAGLSRQSRLCVTDADFEQACHDYDEWRTAEKEAKRRKEYARELLRGRSGSASRYDCAWSGGNERYAVDVDAALQLLASLGQELPTKVVVSPRQIRLTRKPAPPEETPGG